MKIIRVGVDIAKSVIRRQLAWPVVLPHLIITLSHKPLPHLKDTSCDGLY
jgi:hypothetical protein